MSTATTRRRKRLTRARQRSAFSARLAELLARTGVLPGLLARRARVDESSIHRYLRGSYEPNLRHVRSIARALGVAPTLLLEDGRGEVLAVIERGRVLLYRGPELVGEWLGRDMPPVIHPIRPTRKLARSS